MQEWAESVIELWRVEGIELNPGASEDEIAEVEKRIDVKFPLSFIVLHRMADGFKDWEWNYHMFSIWSLKRIEEEYVTGKDKNYVGICDFLINSHAFGFLKGEVNL
jgi:cell wall assembly regulator SMI1